MQQLELNWRAPEVPCLKTLLPALWPVLPFTTVPDWPALFSQRSFKTSEDLELDYYYSNKAYIDPYAGGSNWSESADLRWQEPRHRMLLRLNHEDVVWVGPQLSIYLISNWPPALEAWESLSKAVSQHLQQFE